MFFLIYMAFFAARVGNAAPGPVHVAVPAGLPPPLLFEREEELTGVVPEYTRALVESLGRKGTYSLLPRNRLTVYLREGKVDFLCYTSYPWADDRDLYGWTDTLFMKREVILGPEPVPKEIKALKGKTLGTMLGYSYPKIDGLFKDKIIYREDGPNEEANFNKLRNGHIDYLIVDEMFLDYYKKQHPEIDKGRGRMLLQEYPVACSVSKKGRVSVKKLNKAIAKLKSSGKLMEIFKKYGMSYQ